MLMQGFVNLRWGFWPLSITQLWPHWLAHHSDEFPPVHLEVPHEIPKSRKLYRVDDSSLRALDGHEVRFSDFRGKVVLINFWPTWCTACVSEMPELIALQKQHGDKLAI